MSRFIRHVSCVLMSLSCISANAQSVADNPIQALEKTDLVLPDNIGGQIAWIDNQNLLVTVLRNDPGARWWVRRVVSVDIRSGQAEEFAARGFVSCANPVSGLIGIGHGTLAASYEGGSKEPPPNPHLYKKSFWSSALVPFKDEDEWNKWLCIKTSKAELNDPNAGNPQSEYRYLQTSDDLLRVTKKLNEQQNDVVYGMVLEHEGKKIPLAGLDPQEAGWRIPFLPFMNRHLLSPGMVSTGVMQFSRGYKTSEVPTITMTKEGKIERKLLRDELIAKGLNKDSSVVPYANGSLILVGDRPRDGGGIYRLSDGRLERIWCINKGNAYDRKCAPKSISLSPNGCSLAFFDEGSDDLKISSPRVSLKILNVCH